MAESMRLQFHIVHIGVRTITIETEDRTPYERDREYQVCVDGTKVLTTKQNVVTIYGLRPDTEYGISLTEGSVATGEERVRTLHESVLLNVRDFHAIGDGVTNDTAAIQTAILCAPKDATVYIPAGTYHVTPLFLKSNMNLWLDKGAVLLGDPNRKNYPVLPGMTRCDDERSEYNLSSWEGNPLTSFASLITAVDCENVSLFGEGVIDGNGQNGDWWQNEKVKRIAWRPNTVYFCRCRNCHMTGVRVCNSPSWTIHPYYCDNISFYNLSIENPAVSPNTDGFDPESCTNVLLLGTRISVGDDCVAIKSGKYYMSRYHFKRTENVNIRNCRFEHGHGAVTIGSEIACGVTGVHVSRCVFEETDRGLRIKSRRGRGNKSILDDIVFEHIHMNKVRMPMTVNMFYFCDPDGHSDYVQSQEPCEVDELTPYIGSLTVRDVECKDVDASFLCAYGLPEQPIETIHMERVKASFAPEESRVPVCPIMMDNFPEMSGVGVYAHNVANLTMRDVEIHDSVDDEPRLMGIGQKTIERVSFHYTRE